MPARAIPGDAPVARLWTRAGLLLPGRLRRCLARRHRPLLLALHGRLALRRVALLRRRPLRVALLRGLRRCLLRVALLASRRPVGGRWRLALRRCLLVATGRPWRLLLRWGLALVALALRGELAHAGLAGQGVQPLHLGAVPVPTVADLDQHRPAQHRAGHLLVTDPLVPVGHLAGDLGELLADRHAERGQVGHHPLRAERVLGTVPGVRAHHHVVGDVLARVRPLGELELELPSVLLARAVAADQPLRRDRDAGELADAGVELKALVLLGELVQLVHHARAAGGCALLAVAGRGLAIAGRRSLLRVAATGRPVLLRRLAVARRRPLLRGLLAALPGLLRVLLRWVSHDHLLALDHLLDHALDGPAWHAAWVADHHVVGQAAP